jgi:arylsulfatase A-like enzyme
MTSKLLRDWRKVGRVLLLGMAGAIALPSWGAQPANPPAAPARKPNIIFILADDLGYGDLGCYGQTKIKTPNLDKLAADGVRFTQFYAGSTVCAPSRCALMTGLHTGHTLIRGNANVPLRPQDLTMAEVLKQARYRTGLIGKWGLGNEQTTGVPQKKGFDEFIGYLDQVHAHDYYTDYLWRYDPPSAAKEGYDGRMDLPQNQGGKKDQYVPDLCTAAALSFLRINKPDQFNNYRPFFLYLAYTIPHANNEEGRRTGNGMEVPSDAPYSDQPWPQPEKNKAAMITRLDADIGQLMDKLKELKIENNTVVFFSSDNGPHKEGGVDPKFFQSSGPLRGIKRDLYEGGIRVPLIVRWPARIRPGTVNDQPWAFWDFLPTAAEMAQAKLPEKEKLDGQSLLPALLGRAQTNRHEFFYWEFHERGFQQAVRMGDWKAVRPAPGAALELYNLQADPGERENVAQKNPQAVTRIEAYLKTARTESEHWPIKPPRTGPTPEKGGKK